MTPEAPNSLSKKELVGLVVAMAEQISALPTRKLDTVAERNFWNAMEKARDKLFVFVTRRNVPPTNNLSERLLRLSVIFRKLTNGFRSAWGAQVNADICSATALDAIRTSRARRSIIATV